MKKEKTIEGAFVEWCKSQGWRCPKYIDAGGPGTPDRTVCFGCSVKVYVEFKRNEKEVLRPSQVRYIRILRRAGEMVLVTHDLEEAKRWTLEQYSQLNTVLTFIRTQRKDSFTGVS